MKTVRYAFWGLLLGIASSCHQPAPQQDDTGGDSAAANEAKQAAPAPAGFEVARIPVSDAPLGAFPYFSLPKGYEYVSDEKPRDYDRFPFWVGDHFQWEAGKVFQGSIDAGEGKEYSGYELKKNLDDLITASGGVKIFDGRIPGDSTSVLRDRPDDITVDYVDGLGDIYNDPAEVYVIRREDRILWIHLCVSSASAGWVILETKPFVRTASLIPAEQLKKALADSGKAVLHILFATDRADILPGSVPQVDAIVRLLGEDTLLKLSVNGYTDNTGETMHNLVLSQRRALAVVKALEAKGIDHGRLKSRGFGEQHPRADNGTETGRAENRRVELVKR